MMLSTIFIQGGRCIFQNKELKGQAKACLFGFVKNNVYIFVVKIFFLTFVLEKKHFSKWKK